MITPVKDQRRKQEPPQTFSERHGSKTNLPSAEIQRKRTLYYRDIWRQNLIEDVFVALDTVERDTQAGYSLHVARRRAVMRLHHSVGNAFELAVLAEHEHADQRSQLAPRLVSTLDHLDRGLTIGEIARAMGITVSTVRDYVKDIREFFQTSKKEEAVRKARMLGYLPVREILA